MSTCADCEARRKMARDALYKAKLGEALGHVVKGAAEMTGLVQKTAVSESAQKKPAAKKRVKQTIAQD